MNINIETAWLNMGEENRIWTLRNCGWADKTTLTNAKKSWDKLSPAMQNVLKRKAAEGVIGL